MYMVLKHINEHLKEKLTMESLAEQFGYSGSYFCESFRKYVGITFTEYLRRRRMDCAAADLVAGRKVLDIALDYGYETAGGFNKAFLKNFGCFPKEYVQNVRYYQYMYEEKRKHMYEISDRVSLLRAEAVEQKKYTKDLYGQRDFWFYKGMAQEQREGNDRKIAAGILSVAQNIVVVIKENERIVGMNYGNEEGVLYGEVNLSGSGLEGREQELLGYVEAAQKAYKYVSLRDVGADEAFEQEVQRLCVEELAADGHCLLENHSVIGYEQVIKYGFSGLAAEVRGHAAKNGDASIYDSALTLCRAGEILGARYADAAEAMAATQPNQQTAAELREIAEVCRQVPKGPARTFHEAIQSLWFAHMLNTWEDYVNANSLGRLDQILYPYYKKDIAEGRITKSEAFELICCLWIKLYRDYDVQQSCVGGRNSDGTSAVNELSYLMLDATEALGFVRCLSVRYDGQTEKEFIKRALEVVGHEQKGVPFFFNDSVMVPALINAGIAPEDAWDYTQIGCVETVIPGKSNPHAVTARCNMLKALEYVLHQGNSGLDGKPAGLNLGTPESFTTYAKLDEAVRKQLAWLIDRTCNMVYYCEKSARGFATSPYKSLLTEGCMESGKHFNQRGAKYDYYQFDLTGGPNLADSLAAIRELVYKQKKYTLSQVVQALRDNFPSEAMRMEFINKAPKYGNDIDAVDDIVRDYIAFSCDCLEQNSIKYEMPFHAQPFSFLWMVDFGWKTGASADGRRSGEILAYSQSPMQGRDFNGFTAVLNSLCKIDTKRTPGTTSAIVEVDPQLFTDKNIPYFADIMLAAADQGLSNIQFNVVDAETLKDAQLHPDKHRGLAVRVSGFSQKFELLSKPIQDHIIARTKHTVL